MRESKLTKKQTVLKTNIDPKQKNDKKKHPPYAYVCLEYQKDRCKKRGRCHYEHRKLNGQEAKQLENFMKQKRELRDEINRKNNEKEKILKTQISEMSKQMENMAKMMSEMQKKQN
jgi:small-conductance mechanosensitive channel